MTYYLGRAGALVALPDPEAGLPQAPERIGGTHQLLSGNRVRDTLGRMRTWNLEWTAIDLTTYGTLQSFYYGTVGPGPYVFLDPEQRNLLPPNVASGGDVTGTTAGFTGGAGVALSVSTDFNYNLGGRCSILSGETAGVIANQDLVTLFDFVKIAASLPYTFSMQAWSNAASPSRYAALSFYDSAAAHISTFNSSTLASGANGRLSVTATAPSNAMYAFCRIRAGAANTSGTTQFAYTDGWQLEQASSVTAWVPGTGSPLVTVESLSRTTPLAGLCDAQMTLVQVG